MGVKIAITGAGGAMGQTLLRLIKANACLELMAAIDREGASSIGQDCGLMALNQPNKILISDDLEIAAKNCDCLIDFTIPEATIANLYKAKNTNIKGVIIGTTGFNQDQEEEIASFTRDFAIVKSGNFSLGVNLLAGFVEKAAQILGDDWDIEIIDAHHRRKIDAPSGTALLLGNAAASGRGIEFNDARIAGREGITGARPKGAIGFAAIRGGAIVGEHDVRFESDYESLILSHRAYDRAIFAKGALHAAAWVFDKPKGLYEMKDVLEL